MNKTAIKNFAVEARVMLINAVTQLAYEFEVTENGTNDPAQESVSVRTALRRRWRKPPILGSIVSSHCDSWRSIIICRPIREYSRTRAEISSPRCFPTQLMLRLTGSTRSLCLNCSKIRRTNGYINILSSRSAML